MSSAPPEEASAPTLGPASLKVEPPSPRPAPEAAPTERFQPRQKVEIRQRKDGELLADPAVCDPSVTAGGRTCPPRMRRKIVNLAGRGSVLHVASRTQPVVRFSVELDLIADDPNGRYGWLHRLVGGGLPFTWRFASADQGMLLALPCELPGSKSPPSEGPFEHVTVAMCRWDCCPFGREWIGNRYRRRCRDRRRRIARA